MAKRKVSEIETGAGFFMGFVNATMDVVRQKAIPFAAVYWLATAGGRKTLSAMIDLAYADWQVERLNGYEKRLQGNHEYRGGPTARTALPPNHYRVHVDRGPLPSMTILGTMEYVGGSSILWNGGFTWKKHQSREGAKDVMDPDIIMVAKLFTPEEISDMGSFTSKNIIAWGLGNGLVAADEKEAYAFWINSDTLGLQRSHRCVALGSSTMYNGCLCVPTLDIFNGTRMLGDGWFDSDWNFNSAFLFVRRDSA